jgi:hypothetical protein
MRKQRILLSLLPLSLLFGAFGIVTVACGGSSSATGSTGTAGGSPTGPANDCFDYSTFDGGSPAVSFKADVLPIWRLSCGLSTSCHGNPSPTVVGQHYYGPPMSAPEPSAADITKILAGTVGVDSVDEPEMAVVKAGDPAHSFMMYKLDGDPSNIAAGVNCKTALQCATASPNGCLESMPQGGPELGLAQRNTIRSWIAQGAQNN